MATVAIRRIGTKNGIMPDNIPSLGINVPIPESCVYHLDDGYAILLDIMRIAHD